MKILALDLGTQTGWALHNGECLVGSGTQKFDVRRGESPGMRFVRFVRWLQEMTLLTHSDSRGDETKAVPLVNLIAYEAPHHRGGAATEIACGFSTRIHELCARYEIQHASVHTATLKKHATGFGKASKEAMKLNAFKVWGIDVKTDDEADALAVLAWALEESEGS